MLRVAQLRGETSTLVGARPCWYSWANASSSPEIVIGVRSNGHAHALGPEIALSDPSGHSGWAMSSMAPLGPWSIILPGRLRRRRPIFRPRWAGDLQKASARPVAIHGAIRSTWRVLKSSESSLQARHSSVSMLGCRSSGVGLRRLLRAVSFAVPPLSALKQSHSTRCSSLRLSKMLARVGLTRTPIADRRRAFSK